MSKRPGMFEFGVTRECLSCHNEYSTHVDEVHLYWYPMKTTRWYALEDADGNYLCDDDGETLFETREIIVPSTLCIECEKRRTSDARQLRRDIKKLPPAERAVAEATRLGGYCDCCRERKMRGKRQYVRRGAKGYALCELCRERCDIADWDAEGARSVWIHLLKHNAAERSLNAKWAENHDRRRVSHSTFPREDGKGTGWRNATPEDVADVPPVYFTCGWEETAWKRVHRFLQQVSDDAAEPSGVDGDVGTLPQDVAAS